MKKYIFMSLLFAFYSMVGFAQEKVNPETIREAQRNVCAINIAEKESGKTYTLGCGVVFSSKIGNRNEDFVATAFHIVKDLISNPGLQASINVFDQNGNIYTAEGLTGKNVVWRNFSMDAALLVLPRDLKPNEQISSEYEFPGLANL